MQTKIFIAGIGTNVGKTRVSAVLAQSMHADYWKPIECGKPSDTETMYKLLDPTQHHIYPPAYSLKSPLSPHHAAQLEGICIDIKKIHPPKTNRILIIETVGGIFSPLTENVTSLDLFTSWKGSWVIVSTHYLGSINHTLLTLDALKHRNIPILGLIFHGTANPHSEAAILNISKVPILCL